MFNKNSFRTTHAILILSAWVGCCGTLAANAQNNSRYVSQPEQAAPQQPPAPTVQHRPHRVARPFVPPHSSSEETRAERERRLARECKGRANAGACLGFGDF